MYQTAATNAMIMKMGIMMPTIIPTGGGVSVVVFLGTLVGDTSSERNTLN